MQDRAKVVFRSREETGTGVCRKLRVEGLIPAVLYGPAFPEGKKGVVGYKEVLPVVSSSHWETTILELDLGDGRQEMALMREIQRHALTRSPLHIDFLQLVKDHKIRVKVPVHLDNRDTCAGVKLGGLLEQFLYELEVEVLPQDIPEQIRLNVQGLGMNKEIKVSDVPLPQGATWVQDPDSVVVSLVPPKGAEEEALPEEEQEIQVVAKGKAKKEGEA
ncbi:50S ribosomal protein L25 [Aminomonas paucivorans]|uniref:Large ribosomal subunit protein bL25 n=1 Tax=Aminomonas paucivorans DSM 12260 TaxID=584708 RepID=E3CYT1_9BACT|nr:50S ribosomal protein L25 [Aminomonas paucivorans]EFQ23709.1 LSU ribosomal protein L25P [Aminomonas paucivorans DSM 12260]